MMLSDYEKLGVFYLGREFDPGINALKDERILYDSKDLTTHAVCVGMTGSGKTGLCVSLLEEAAIDGVPAICIDPKGDLGNLMLTFPDLAPADFEPWVDAGDAARKGVSVAELAAKTAETWKSGLAEWDQTPERIGKLRAAADVAIYTPGADAGLPLSVLRSFSPPAAGLAGEQSASERITAVVSGLLSLLNIDADPIGSREHILLANILEGAWRQGLSLDIAGLIQAVQKPAFDKLGAFDLETFFPAKDRLKLAMGLNSLLASPGFAAWMQGEPLDAQRLLFTPEGKPRISIISIAHLNDAERMFIVTLVLNEVIAWMRTQSGTGSLRAILYMDEIFGFFPPTANPPSKQPMLTLLKQARAFGLGVVLATQNPVDLDYKGLANCGTWFIGRLQTERDKLRVIEGLKSALPNAQGDLEGLMSNLTQRVFLMRNVHEDAPVLMKTRWALSYLRGPLTGPEIARVMAARKAVTAPAATASPSYSGQTAPASQPAGRPAVGSGIAEYFLAATKGTGPLLYKPMVAGFAKLHYVDSRLALDEWQTIGWLAPFDDGGGNASWEDATADVQLKSRLAAAPAGDVQYGELPATALRAASFSAWAKTLQAHLYETARAHVLWCEAFDAVSKAGESEGDFRARLTLAAREKRDAAVAELRQRWQAKLQQLQEQVRRAEERREREKSQLTQQRMQTAVSIGSSILGALLGRKALSATNLNRVGTAARSATRMGHESQDVARAEEGVETLQQRLADAKVQVEADVARLETTLDADTISLRAIDVPARKSDIAVGEVALVWAPWRKGADGFPTPAYD